MDIFELRDRLGETARNLAAIERRVTPSVGTRPAGYFPRTRLGSPNGWLENLIKTWVGPLVGLYGQLQEAGIISPGQAAAGLSKEELIALIKAMQPKPWYEQPWAPWVVCGIAGVGSIIGATVYYLTRKPKT